MLIIDCHGHYTTAPKALESFREAQLACLAKRDIFLIQGYLFSPPMPLRDLAAPFSPAARAMLERSA